MSLREHQFLQSEIATLEGLLSDLSDERVIERLGFQHRLQEARDRLQQILRRPHARALPITFRGDPVEGSHSIDATFASEALKAFVEATDTVAASLMIDDLKGRGRLPGSRERTLRIVDTAIGSFGFELELPPLTSDEPANQLVVPGFPETTDHYADAITTTFELIRRAASSDESTIPDLVAEIHPRAASKVRAFAKVLSDSQALFAAEFDGQAVRLSHPREVQHILDALDESSISEVEDIFSATVLGILPNGRQFEARLESGELIKGKVDRSLSELADFKSSVENQLRSLRFRIVTVRSNRRYVLLGHPTEASEPSQP
jgi:hypothetical protein